MAKLLVYFMLLLFILGSGGGFGYLMHQTGSFAGALGEVRKVFTQSVARSIALETIAVPISQKGKIVKYLYFNFTISSTDNVTQQRIYALIPRIRDAFLYDLLSFYNKVSVKQAVDITSIRKRLQLHVDEILGVGHQGWLELDSYLETYDVNTP